MLITSHSFSPLHLHHAVNPAFSGSGQTPLMGRSRSPSVASSASYQSSNAGADEIHEREIIAASLSDPNSVIDMLPSRQLGEKYQLSFTSINFLISLIVVCRWQMCFLMLIWIETWLKHSNSFVFYRNNTCNTPSHASPREYYSMQTCVGQRIRVPAFIEMHGFQSKFEKKRKRRFKKRSLQQFAIYCHCELFPWTRILIWKKFPWLFQSCPT